MNTALLPWLVVFVLVMVPVWAVFLFVRTRLGVNERAWAAASYSGSGVGADSSARAHDDPDFRVDRRERPGHCPSCGELVDEYEFDRCWNCSKSVRR